MAAAKGCGTKPAKAPKACKPKGTNVGPNDPQGHMPVPNQETPANPPHRAGKAAAGGDGAAATSHKPGCTDPNCPGC